MKLLISSCAIKANKDKGNSFRKKSTTAEMQSSVLMKFILDNSNVVAAVFLRYRRLLLNVENCSLIRVI
jgi:hypothetical protein